MQRTFTFRAAVALGMAIGLAALLAMHVREAGLAAHAAVDVPILPGDPVAIDLAAERKLQYDDLAAQIRNRAWFTKIADQTYRPESLVLATDRDPADVVLRRTQALLADIQAMPDAPDLAKPAAQLATLARRTQATDVADIGARAALYDDLCILRRRIAFANPLLTDLTQVLFAKTHHVSPHMCDQYFGHKRRKGGGVYVLAHPFSAEPMLRDVLRDATVAGGRLDGRPLTPGAFLSPDLSHDGRQVLFAYTELAGGAWSEKSSLHIFRVNTDGTGLVQLTDGTWNDFDPCWLPNGRIVFISERRGGYGRCHGRPVPNYTLHTMNPDGSDIVTTSFHETNEWHPSVNNDGMVVYTRWDYIDRGTNIAHHPWITTPDGCDARAIQGNFPKRIAGRPWMEMDVRAIPGARTYITTAAPHHGGAYGSLVLLDPDVEDDDAMGPLKRITPEIPFPEAEGGREAYATAWPLSEDYYLCGYGLPKTTEGLYLVDAFGNKELLYRDATIGSISPLPLRPRTKPPIIPPLTSVGLPPGWPAPATVPRATVTVMNVYDGRLPWPEGTQIAALRVMQVLPKTTPLNNRPAIGYGTQGIARAVLGTVPVESDGSAYFEAPVGKEIYFQALDANGLAIQSMRSGTYVHPGQRLSCQGCHDRRTASPPAPTATPRALQRAPSRLTPEVDGSHPLNYVRLIQPVLDRHCVDCHTNNAPKAPDLRGTPGARNGWTQSYANLQKYAFYFGSPKPGDSARTTPGNFGARASALYRMLAAGHHDVKLPAEDLHRLTLWLDANSDFYGTFEDTAEQARGAVVKIPLD